MTQMDCICVTSLISDLLDNLAGIYDGERYCVAGAGLVKRQG